MASSNVLSNHLKVILGNQVESDIVDYIKGMKHEEDLEEFMESIVDRNNSAHVTSYESIRKLLFGNKRLPSKNFKAKSNGQPQDHSKQQQQQQQQQQQLNAKKGKKKFSDMSAFQEKKKKSEGRKECDCEAQIHEFMNNCLNCGRIHCIEEGPGPCFYCGEPITVLGQEAFENISKKSNIRHKENKVFDDDNDYFKTTKDDSKKEDKRKIVVALDFATRRIIESTEEDLKIKQKLHEDVKKHLINAEKLYKKLQKESQINTVSNNNNDLVDLLIQMRHKKPQGVEDDLSTEDNRAQIIDYGKIYDEDLIANNDYGLCLSLHQPYASLLVAGVKKHEGRMWKTNHRGRLWIAAAAKIPDEDEITALEDFYRHYYDDYSLKFPREYPTSCLLGCVYVDDCLDQEAYRKQYPNGESSSPYVLICSNPIILPIFYPIVGQHKIYPLDKELHNCAKLSIRHAKYGID